VVTTSALMGWFTLVILVVVVPVFAPTSSVVCQRHLAATIIVLMACNLSQMLDLVEQPHARMSNVVRPQQPRRPHARQQPPQWRQVATISRVQLTLSRSMAWMAVAAELVMLGTAAKKKTLVKVSLVVSATCSMSATIIDVERARVVEVTAATKKQLVLISLAAMAKSRPT